MPSTLVVIDMQDDFEAANQPDCVVGVTKEILLAKQRRDNIVFVEYIGCSPTHNGLLDLLKNYSNKARIKKSEDDGSREIIKVLKRRNFRSKKLRICGVNADCCVWDTVFGLLKRLKGTQIEVVKDACGWSGYNQDWRTYFKDKNLRLI